MRVPPKAAQEGFLCVTYSGFNRNYQHYVHAHQRKAFIGNLAYSLYKHKRKIFLLTTMGPSTHTRPLQELAAL